MEAVTLWYPEKGAEVTQVTRKLLASSLHMA